MKKVIYFAATLLLGLTFTSCEKDEIGGTATESMAGQWYCTVDAVDDNGNIITSTLDGSPNDGENYFGLDNPRTLILTYNTADNSPSEMWIDNMGIGNFSEEYANYWENYGFFPTYTIKSKVTIDQSTLTFRSVDAPNFGAGYKWLDKDKNVFHEEKAMPVTIEGKILKGAGRQNNGSPADSIIFYVKYTNDPWYPDDGYAKYKVSGIRYSGLAEND